MENSSREIIFTLTGLNDTRTNKHIYFVFALFSYLFTLFANLTLIVTIVLEKVLHEPMHIFLCNLCVNGIFSATGFYPKFLIDLLSDSHVVSYSACITQTFVIYVYLFSEFTNLTLVAYDRYVAICRPLEYHCIMTPRKVGTLLLVTWLLPFCETNVGLILTLRLSLCEFNINRLYCFNWDVVKLSSTDTTSNNLYDYFLMLWHVCQVIFIIISYIHIIRTCLQSWEEQSTFMQTCMPHLITLTNFTLLLLFDVMYARYGSIHSLQTLRNILSVEYLLVPPVLNPLIYGWKLNRYVRVCGGCAAAKLVHSDELQNAYAQQIKRYMCK